MLESGSMTPLQRIVVGVLHAAMFFVVALFPSVQMASFLAESTVLYTFLFLLAGILGLYWLASSETLLPAAGLTMLGALLGFLFRPAAPEAGQLPFSTIITRGATGPFDESNPVVVAVAQSSFNVLMAGAILGLAVGLGLAVRAARRGRADV